MRLSISEPMERKAAITRNTERKSAGQLWQVCSDTATARLVKEHNNANIIAFGARIVGTELAKDIVRAYLDAEFQGGRHQTRIDMIHEIERHNA